MIAMRVLHFNFKGLVQIKFVVDNNSLKLGAIIHVERSQVKHFEQYACEKQKKQLDIFQVNTRYTVNIYFKVVMTVIYNGVKQRT